MSYYKKGWDGVNDEDDYGNDGGSESKWSDNQRLYAFRFNIPTPEGTEKRPNLVHKGRPVTKRILFLDSEPFTLFEHGTYKIDGAFNTLGAFTVLCLKKNGFQNSCTFCSHTKNYAYFIGFFPIIDMGQVEYRSSGIELHHEYWENSKGERTYNKFQRVLLGAKRGSEEKPGPLRNLYYQMERRGGDLTGTVWDVTRTGKKASIIGDQWEFVDKIDKDRIDEYLIKQGAEAKDLDLSIPDYTNSEGTGVFDFDVESLQDKMHQLVGIKKESSNKSSAQQKDGATVSGAGWDDDDIPF